MVWKKVIEVVVVVPALLWDEVVENCFIVRSCFAG